MPKKDDKKGQPENEAEAVALTIEQKQQIREIAGSFGREIPDAARKSGTADLSDDPRYASTEMTAPDGLYRVHGSDWLLRIEGSRFVEAARATAPAFGGPNVIDVPNE